MKIDKVQKSRCLLIQDIVSVSTIALNYRAETNRKLLGTIYACVSHKMLQTSRGRKKLHLDIVILKYVHAVFLSRELHLFYTSEASTMREEDIRKCTEESGT